MENCKLPAIKKEYEIEGIKFYIENVDGNINILFDGNINIGISGELGLVSSNNMCIDSIVEIEQALSKLRSEEWHKKI